MLFLRCPGACRLLHREETRHEAHHAIAATLAAGTVAVAGAPAAHAAPAQAATPTCAAASTWSSGVWTYARATNNCSTAQRFYFLGDWAVDGPCVALNSGWYRDEGRIRQAVFRGFQDC